jgi:hypothetical protein
MSACKRCALDLYLSIYVCVCVCLSKRCVQEMSDTSDYYRLVSNVREIQRKVAC